MIVTLSLWYDMMLLQDIGMLSTYNLQKRCKEKWEGIVMRCGHWPIWQTIVPPPTRVFAYHHTKLHVWLHSSFVFVAHSLQHAELHHATLIFDQPPRVGQSELNKFHSYLKYQQVIYVMMYLISFCVNAQNGNENNRGPQCQAVCDGTQNIKRYRYQYFFPVPNIFDTDTGPFFGTKLFRYRFRDFFPIPNFTDTGSETFFRYQIFPIPPE